MKADLHVHTNISDSSLSVEDTVKLAAQNGITHLGITDHDTTAGVFRAIVEGDRLGVKIIPGIEISAFSYEKKKKVHILGFDYKLQAKNLNKLCSPLLERRTRNSLRQTEIIIGEDYDISLDEVKEKAKKSTAVYKQHIMDVLIDKGYSTSIYSDLYRKLFKNEGICAGDIDYINMFDAVRAVKEDGGLAILAHPGQLDSFELVDELIKVGLDGIEINHPDHNSGHMEEILKLQKKLGFILTGGSDYHGRYGNGPDIGSILTPEEYLKFF